MILVFKRVEWGAGKVVVGFVLFWLEGGFIVRVDVLIFFCR